MMHRPSLLAVCLCVFAFAEARSQEDPKPVRVLLVTGSDVRSHKWRETTPATRLALEQRGAENSSPENSSPEKSSPEKNSPEKNSPEKSSEQNGGVAFEVFVCEDAAILESSTLAARYDLLVLSLRNPPTEPLSEKARENLKAFLGEGKGLAAIHFAIGACRDWPEYRNIVGRVFQGKRQKGPSGHAPYGPIEVKIREGKHPLTAGLRSFATTDELYARLVGETPIEVHATAHSEFSDADEPLAWTLSYKKGRVFVLTLGHDAASRQTEGFQELLRRGCAWAAGRL